MMAQFLEIKSDYPNALLFYRMGDFYEMFFDDAVAAAEALDISLTKRGKHLGQDIPMCGVPFHAAENYLLTLIRKGFSVAVCEQLETPAEAKKRGAKSVVNRGVVRLVTAGTLTEDTLLSPREHNYLAAFTQVRDQSAFAWLDVSTGDFSVQSIASVMFGPMLARINPAEILVPETLSDTLAEACGENDTTLSPLAPSSFDSASSLARLCDLFKVQSLDGFGQFSRAETAALGAIVDYLNITQRGKLPLVKPPVRESEQSIMEIDAATRRNLELSKTLTGDRRGSLLYTIDRTITAAGARLLERRLASPSTQVTTINNRLSAVTEFLDNSPLRVDTRQSLRQTADIERALTRISLDRGGPRDLLAIRQSLAQASTLHSALSQLHAKSIEEMVKDLVGHDALISLLDNALNDDVPLLARDGGFVASGYNATLDEAKTLRDEGRKVISALQATYAKQTGITSLKVKHNNVLGYFIETPATHAKTMLDEPLSQDFIHRQTTANAVRFTTLELSELETKILNAAGQAQALEVEIFGALCTEIMANGPEIANTARALAQIDLATALADLAASENWCRPKMTDDRQFKITKGRHPVVEAALKKDASGSFIANDCTLSAGTKGDKPIWLLTGPNMAGKSTFLRQNALIVLLAQMGSYVPAEAAEIGVVTQLFSRVGASDDLARGRSTFMVEMVETAAILNQAGDKALVILDEIGRGTATYDGLSIAWATLENLHDVNQCRTLFATHYHELTGLNANLVGLENATVSVREWKGEIIFLHEVKQGAADRSYGVQVAKLAGLPNAVVGRAKEVLAKLESGAAEGAGKTQTLIDELPLFNATPTPVAISKESAVEQSLQKIMPDELTPKQALALIYELKEQLQD